MVGDNGFSSILRRYGLNYWDLTSEQRENIVAKADPVHVEEALKYLINEVGVPLQSIMKCPSVLYFNPTGLRGNYEFLVSKGITNEKIFGCLHVLNSYPGVIKDSYDYVSENYGVETFNKNVSILGVKVDRIKEIEMRFSKVMSKNAILSAAITTLRIPEIASIVVVCQERGVELTGSFFQKTSGTVWDIIQACQDAGIEITGGAFKKRPEEIRKIARVCKEKNQEFISSMFMKDAEEVGKIIDVAREKGLEVTGSLFRRNAQEISDICDVCRKYNVKVCGSAFLRSAEEVEKIIKMCNENGITLVANMFKKKADEFEAVINLCNKYHVPIDGAYFEKSIESLEKSIEYVIENYGTIYLQPGVVTVDVKHLKKVLPHLQERGTIQGIIPSPTILTLKYDEILERERVLQQMGEADIVNGRFNPIYGLSRKRYKAKVEALGLDVKGASK